MSHIGKKKSSGSIIKRRMTEFSPKQKSVIGQTKSLSRRTGQRIREEKTKLVHRAQRGLSKIATKEEAKKVYKGVKKVVTSKEAKSVARGIGGFLKGWAMASRAAMERNRKRGY